MEEKELEWSFWFRETRFSIPTQHTAKVRKVGQAYQAYLPGVAGPVEAGSPEAAVEALRLNIELDR